MDCIEHAIWLAPQLELKLEDSLFIRIPAKSFSIYERSVEYVKAFHSKYNNI